MSWSPAQRGLQAGSRASCTGAKRWALTASSRRSARRRARSRCIPPGATSVADRGRGALEAAVGGLVEQEGGDVGAGDAEADLVAPEIAGADAAGALAVGGRMKRAIVQSGPLSMT